MENQNQIGNSEEVKSQEAGEVEAQEAKSQEAGEVEAIEEKEASTAIAQEEEVVEGGGLKSEPKEVSIEDIMAVEDGQDKEKVKGTPDGVQRRIDKEVSKRKFAEEEARKARERLKEIEAREIAQKQPVVPLADDFDTTEEYRAAMHNYLSDVTAYNNSQAIVEKMTEEDKEGAAENDERLLSQAEELKAKYPDALDRIQKTKYGNATEAISDSKHNARIGLYLSMNQNELTRIASLTDTGAINREIGRLEAKFESAKTKTTKAPTPLDIARNTVSGETKSTAEMSDAEWYANYKKEKELKFKTQHS